jgi:hypothetical protein
MSTGVACPECGKPQRDLWDHNWGSREELTVSCGTCGADFVLSRIISVEYEARRIGKRSALRDACASCGSSEHTDCGQQ